MGEELAAGHPLPVDVAAERVAHPAVKAGQAHAGGDGVDDVFRLDGRERAAGPDRHDQRQPGETGGVIERAQRVGHLHLEAAGGEFGCEQIGALFRFVAIPATPDDEGIFHR